MPENDASVDEGSSTQAPRTVTRSDSAPSRLRPSRRVGRPAASAQPAPAEPVAAPLDAEPTAVEPEPAAPEATIPEPAPAPKRKTKTKAKPAATAQAVAAPADTSADARTEATAAPDAADRDANANALADADAVTPDEASVPEAPAPEAPVPEAPAPSRDRSDRERAPEPAAEPAAEPAPAAAEPAEPLTKPALPPRSPSEPAPAAAPAASRAEAAPAEVHVGERTGRIEIPVPSVVRARERAAKAAQNPVILQTESLTKSYGNVIAAGDIDLIVREGSFTGVVGPNGAGKTTTLSMITGLLRPSSGRVTVHGVDVWEDGPAAKRIIGVLPDRLRLFDRLTGAQLLFYSGILQGLDEAIVNDRARELASAFGLESALGRLVSDYSAGMQKKIALACSMIHAPKVLVLDEPFEAIDPVSAANVTEILEKFVAGGGSVVMSSHSLDLIQRICDHVAVIIDGEMIAQGTVDEVRDGVSLEERFIDLIQRSQDEGGMEWLHRSSDSD